MYCTQCGNALLNTAKFCSFCGHPISPIPQTPAITLPQTNMSHTQIQPPKGLQPVQNPSPSPHVPQSAPPVYVQQPTPQPIIQPTEHTNWVFTANYRISMMKIVPCNIVFRDDHLILAYLSPERQKYENDLLTKQIKQEGTNFIKGSVSMMQFWNEFPKRYYQIPTNAILAEDPMNRCIPYHQIRKVKFDGYRTYHDDEGGSSSYGGKLSIDSSAGTYKFTHQSSGSKTNKELLSKLFGSRLSYSKG